MVLACNQFGPWRDNPGNVLEEPQMKVTLPEVCQGSVRVSDRFFTACWFQYPAAVLPCTKQVEGEVSTNRRLRLELNIREENEQFLGDFSIFFISSKSVETER